jgi:two-component sensor histidine kinase/PAS domain-containing protein
VEDAAREAEPIAYGGWRAALEASHDWTLVISLADGRASPSPQWFDRLGHGPADGARGSWLEHYHRSEREDLVALLARGDGWARRRVRVLDALGICLCVESTAVALDRGPTPERWLVAERVCATATDEQLVFEPTRSGGEFVAQLVEGTFDAAPTCIAYLTPECDFVRVNRAYAHAAGKDEDERRPERYAGRAHFEMFPNEENERIFREVARTGIAYTARAKPFEYEGQPEKGVTHWDWSLTPVRSSRGATVGLVLALEDVTNRVRAIEALHASESRLRELVRGRETLLKELHHRVKNNLAVVISLLHLEASRSAVPEAMHSLVESANRVRSIALVHEMLSHSEDLSRIEIGEHLRTLAEQVSSSWSLSDRVARISVESEALWLDIERAVPMSLVVYELLSNALRHAFDERALGERRAEVRIALTRPRPGAARLEVADNGRGLPEAFSLGSTKSLGLRLVSRLAAQLGGRLSVEGDGPGARFAIELPVEEESSVG